MSLREDRQEGFRILEHPSDLGIEAYGRTLARAFEQSASGLISIIVDPSSLSGKESRRVSLAARDTDQLLVKWLEEILYLYDGTGFMTSEAVVEEMTPTGLRAVLRGEAFDSALHTPRLDVKAITYHQLSIRSAQGGFVATVYLDI